MNGTVVARLQDGQSRIERRPDQRQRLSVFFQGRAASGTKRVRDRRKHRNCTTRSFLEKGNRHRLIFVKQCYLRFKLIKVFVSIVEINSEYI